MVQRLEKILDKAIEITHNMTKGLSQEELTALWPSTSEVGSASEIHGSWANEQNTPGFMELYLSLQPDGTGSFIKHASHVREWSLRYTLEASVLKQAFAATDSDDTSEKETAVRLLGGKLLIQDSHGDIAVFVRTGA